jgi:hypothetical protein
VGTIKYRSEEGTIWEFREDGQWYRKNKVVPEAAFYEGGGDKEKLNKFRAGSIDVEYFLISRDDPDSLCPTGRIYLPITRNGERTIMRTRILTRITDSI